MIITVASGNPHKVEEMSGINPFKDIVLKKIEGDFDPVEDGETFEENAIIKAKAASLIVKDFALADDTGLCVDALNGAPGLHTARYAPTQEEKIKKLLAALDGVPFEKRTARFICCMVLTDKDGNVVHKTVGKVEGYIAEKAAGCGGFGYDPIFYVPKYGKTLAELPDGEKNKISHRFNALVPMLEFVNSEKL
ncbi:MAG: RdgB/HAM1 family non-canonical purine NTP pyrophosphatase [bacterium]|nr:RdgB/HAM1 family non-canonical purine NTP pyrophosphatase [bacterium]